MRNRIIPKYNFGLLNCNGITLSGELNMNFVCTKGTIIYISYDYIIIIFIIILCVYFGLAPRPHLQRGNGSGYRRMVESLGLREEFPCTNEITALAQSRDKLTTGI